MANHEEIAGFQFRIDNFYMDGIIDNIGSAIENEFTVSYNANTGNVISFTITGNSIPIGSRILLRFSFSYYILGTLSCINNIVLSDPNGNNAEVSNFSDQGNNCITVE